MRWCFAVLALLAVFLFAGCANGSAAASNQGARADFLLGSF